MYLQSKDFNEALSLKHQVKTLTRAVYKIGCKCKTCKGYLVVLFYLFPFSFHFPGKMRYDSSDKILNQTGTPNV